MTDLDSMLADAGRARDPFPTPDGVVDADVLRGRRALGRHRARRAGARTAAFGALAIVTATILNPGSHGGSATTPPTAAGSSTAADTTADSASPTPPPSKATQLGTANAASIRLVAYTGAQPDGYTVDSVPAGWEIQGVDNYALVIAKKGNPDRDINSFVDKLVVMLQSQDQGETTGNPVAVGSLTGKVSHFDSTAAQLFFTDQNGHKVDIQVPPELNWSDEQIGEFGASIHVNPNAVAGRG